MLRPIVPCNLVELEDPTGDHRELELSTYRGSIRTGSSRENLDDCGTESVGGSIYDFRPYRQVDPFSNIAYVHTNNRQVATECFLHRVRRPFLIGREKKAVRSPVIVRHGVIRFARDDKEVCSNT